MSLTPEGILKLVEAAPGVTIAVYGGSGKGGVLRVVARNGRRVPKDELYLGLGQNVVDGPAVDWATTLRGPRIWISDGGITGWNDSPISLDCAEELERTILRYRVIRVAKLEEAVNVINQLHLKGR